MKRKILQCVNLIGDSLYLLGPVKKYLEKARDEVAAILVLDNVAGQLFVKCFSHIVPVVFSEQEARAAYPDADMFYLEAGRSATICFTHAQNKGKQLHISEGYARLLGVDMEGKIEPPTDWQTYYGQTFPKEYALLSPFSSSCTRHSGYKPNKTLDDWKWEYIIRSLRRHGYEPVKVTGGRSDRLKECSVLESDYPDAFTLPEIELQLRKAKVLISVDNGLCHMASALGVKTIVLWPRVSSLEFIAPAWAHTTAILQMGDPNKAGPPELLVGIRKLLGYLEDGKI